VAASVRLTSIVGSLGRRAFRVGVLRRAALAAGAARGHGLVLVFHRIGDRSGRGGLVPTVPAPLFRQQLEALADAGDIVPLEALLAPASTPRRPRFAVTFDDDYPTHHDEALPALRQLGITATFFLSGRSLHGLGPLWFERVDALIAAEGVRAAAERLGIDTDDPERLAVACERDPVLQERADGLPAGNIRHLAAAEIRTLVHAGMTIGFHTVRHPLLPRLPDAALDEALSHGRRELESAIGGAVRFFAYPHGKADWRTATRVRAAGFAAAFTGRPGPVRPADDPHLLGRWEPGPIALDRFVAGVAARLNGWGRGA
jgi:peptidoglycan/xylan/chitin deacetylase (PgdA/CDA1 family)